MRESVRVVISMHMHKVICEEMEVWVWDSNKRHIWSASIVYSHFWLLPWVIHPMHHGFPSKCSIESNNALVQMFIDTPKLIMQTPATESDFVCPSAIICALVANEVVAQSLQQIDILLCFGIRSLL
jgi:hypothetical protein